MNAAINIKTNNSLLKSPIKINDLINYALENKISTLGIIDDNLYASVEFINKCNKHNIKPIVGLEVNNENYKFYLYPKTTRGYKNLLKINTIIQTEFKIKDLEKYKNDLIVFISKEFLKTQDEIKSVFSEVYLASSFDWFKEINVLTIKDKPLIRYLKAIEKGVTLKDVGSVYAYSLEEYINTDFNDELVLENINITLPKKENLIPVFDKTQDSYTLLKDRIKQKLKQKFSNSVPLVYFERVKYELKTIKEMGFCDYFLIVEDYVKFAKDNKIMVGPGRGSAAGSLIAYLLNITTVDPIEHKLLFERFLNPMRKTMPDIDIDFEYDRRDEVIDYCTNKYGKKNVAPIITFSTLQARQVLRDVSSIMEINASTVNALIKEIEPYKTLKENYNSNKEVRALISKSQKLDILYMVALKLEGLRRHTSIHAAGIVMSEVELDEIIPIEVKNNTTITAITMDYLEELGLIKMDFLGLKKLSIIRKTLNDLGHDIDYEFKDDEEVYQNIFKPANTSGIFQFESRGMIEFLKELKPISFEDLQIAIALYRPGPMQYIEKFINIRENKEKTSFYDEALEEILKPTNGIMIYQEQIMEISRIVAGYTYGEADILRRSMGKKKIELMQSEKTNFIKRAIENGYNESVANKIFEDISHFANFGFNKSHSVSYAKIAYNMAYLKQKHPIYFYKNLINEEIGSKEKVEIYISDLIDIGIKLRRPEINISTNEFVIHNEEIYTPFSLIKGINNILISKIIKERENSKFLNFFDFVKRMAKHNINKEQLKSLISSGVFRDYNRKTLLSNLNLIDNYFEIVMQIGNTKEPYLELQDEYYRTELINLDNEYIGDYFIESALKKTRTEKGNALTTNDISKYFDKRITIILEVYDISVIITKNGEEMAFIKTKDSRGFLDIVVFPKLYKKIDIKKYDIIEVTGRIEKRKSKYSLILEKIN